MTVAYPLAMDLQTAVLTEYDEDNFPSIGVDGDARNVKLQPAEAQHPLGFIARPKDPETDNEGNADAAKACVVLRMSEGNLDHAMALADTRCTPALPRIPKGSAMAYAPSGSDDPPRMQLNPDGESEHIVIHVPATAKVTIEVEGGPQIVVDNGYVHLGVEGGSFVITDNGGAMTAAFAQIQTLFASLGLTFNPPTGIVASKVKAV